MTPKKYIKEIATMDKPSDIYRALIGYSDNGSRKEVKEVHGTDMSNRGLIEMYDGVTYLYPQFAGYYRDRIEVLKQME